MALKLLDRFFDMDDDDNVATDAYPEQVSSNNHKVVSINQGRTMNENGKITLFEPRIYGDARDITNSLLDGQAVIVNFKQMDDQIAVKTVDFLNGAIFAMDGEIKRIGEQIFLCTPKNFDVSGETIADHDNDSQNF